MSIVCPACRHENPDDHEQCAVCGRSLGQITGLLEGNETVKVIICPRCDTTNQADSINCSQCGYYFSTHPFPDNRVKPTFLVPPRILMDSALEEVEEEEDVRARPEDRDAGRLVLQLVLDPQQKISLHGETEYTIGRADPLGNWEPAVDLTPFGGEPGGVSRRHARIFIEDSQPYIEDMGSLNGTYINTVRLITRVPQPLRDGDQLLFGRVLAQLRIKSLKS